MQDDDEDDNDDNDDPMILNIRAKNHTSERTIVPWTVIFLFVLFIYLWSGPPASTGKRLPGSEEKAPINVWSCFDQSCVRERHLQSSELINV